MAEPLRVIDFVPSSPLRSQTLWHALAYGVSQGAPATLSLPAAGRALCCLGYHRLSEEVDRSTAGEKGCRCCAAWWEVGPSTWTAISCFSRSASCPELAGRPSTSTAHASRARSFSFCRFRSAGTATRVVRSASGSRRSADTARGRSRMQWCSAATS